jgi:hypothetical protein
MLSSSTSRFYWAKRSRSTEMSFFRMLTTRWRRPVCHKLDRHLKRSHKFRANPQRGNTAKVTWSPWLWIE